MTELEEVRRCWPKLSEGTLEIQNIEFVDASFRLRVAFAGKERWITDGPCELTHQSGGSNETLIIGAEAEDGSVSLKYHAALVTEDDRREAKLETVYRPIPENYPPCSYAGMMLADSSIIVTSTKQERERVKIARKQKRDDAFASFAILGIVVLIVAVCWFLLFR